MLDARVLFTGTRSRSPQAWQGRAVHPRLKTPNRARSPRPLFSLPRFSALKRQSPPEPKFVQTPHSIITFSKLVVKSFLKNFSQNFKKFFLKKLLTNR